MTENCVDRDLGILLHAYEIGVLPEEDVDRFEAHLINCARCASEVGRSEKVSVALRTDPGIRGVVNGSLSVADEGATSWSRLKEALWPRRSFLLKPAIAYLAMVLLLYPAYLGLRQGPDSSPTDATTVVLTGLRSAATEVDPGSGPLVLYFRVSMHEQGRSYDLRLSSESGETLYHDASFGVLDEREMGSLVVPAEMISPGVYALDLKDQDGLPVAAYKFSVK